MNIQTLKKVIKTYTTYQNEEAMHPLELYQESSKEIELVDGAPSEEFDEGNSKMIIYCEPEEKHFNFEYDDKYYRYYITRDRMTRDMLYQIQVNFGRSAASRSEELIEFFVDFKHKMMINSTGLDTFAMCVSFDFAERYSTYLKKFKFYNQSLTRIYGTKRAYITGISENILNLSHPHSTLNAIFKNIFPKDSDSDEIKNTAHELKCLILNIQSIGATSFNIFSPSIFNVFSDIVGKIFWRHINRTGYLRSIAVMVVRIMRVPCEDIVIDVFMEAYRQMFPTEEHFLTKASCIDLISFLYVNQIIFFNLPQSFLKSCEVSVYPSPVVITHYAFGKNLDTVIRKLIYWFFEYLTGSELFVRSGGESNPGPQCISTMLKKIMEWLKDWAKSQIQPEIDHATIIAQELGELGFLGAHLMRIFTTISDTMTFFFQRKIVGLSPLEFTARMSSLILSLYESHKVFSEKLNLRLRPVVEPQAGSHENILMATVLSYGTPSFIKNLLKEVPKFTNTKILDDITWVYDLFGFMISIPRRILSCFESETQDNFISQIVEMLIAIEDLFPFSTLCRIKRKLDAKLEETKKAPSLLMNKIFQDDCSTLNKERKEVEATYKRHKRNFPSYYGGTSEQFDTMMTNILKYNSTTRVEPVCIVLKGPKGRGKTVALNHIVNMYKNAGCSVYSDVIPASVENKNFYDTYNNEDIYVVDDLGARSKSQWSNIVNMVSSARYPLEAARIEYKDTKYFNSRLMLLTCNAIPASFNPSVDGVADKDALYRRLIIFDFENARYIDGSYTGSVAVQRFDDTPGVRIFKEITKFGLCNGEKTAPTLDLKAIDKYIHNELTIKTKHFEANKNLTQNVIGTPFPQGLMEDAAMCASDIFAGFPGIDYIAGEVVDVIARFADKCSDLKKSNPIKWARRQKYAMFVGLAIAMGGYAIYKTVKGKDAKNEEHSNIHLHYASNRDGRKRNVKNIFANGVQTYDGVPELPVPQLVPYSTNVCVTKFDFQDKEGKSKAATCRGLYSVDKILTTAHMFHDTDYNKPIYITTRIGEQVLYDYMEVFLVMKNDIEDWIIFRIPETAPRYMKKIRMATMNTSRKLYLATGDTKIINLGADIEQYHFGLSYEYGTFSGKLTDKDLMYDCEGEGICGSILLTMDGRIVGMHVAGVEFEENGKIFRKGIARTFNQNSFNLIMGIMSLSVEDKVNLDYEVKERAISGVYIKTNDRCYGVEGTRYTKSPIYGVFTVWRKPALELPKDKQDYKTLTEAMMKPVDQVNLQGVEFAEEALQQISDQKHTNLTEQEIVQGNGIMKRVDPTTSTGHTAKYNDKKHYLDYENGKLTTECKDEMKLITDKIVNGTYDFNDVATVVSKDELKDVIDPTDPDSLPKKIRIFTNYHLFSTILFRFFFGNLMSYVMEHRIENGIMIGINPLSAEWHNFAQRLTMTGRKIFDGDYANYDKNMHPVFQRRLNNWLKQRTLISSTNYNRTFSTNYTSHQVECILDQILECIISTPILSKNKKFITTHGLPSGTALTAFYNSCINKMYTAYVYRMVAPADKCRIDLYYKYADMATYGDDIIGNVSSDIRHFYNPVSFSNIMRSLGLDFTPADKNIQWTEDNQFKDLDQCTFLKRRFYLHPELGQIVAPLDIKSMEGTLNYITDPSRSVELLKDKLYNFQREAYLQPGDYYVNSMRHVRNICREKNISFVPLTNDMLKKMYADNTYADLLNLN